MPNPNRKKIAVPEPLDPIQLHAIQPTTPESVLNPTNPSLPVIPPEVRCFKYVFWGSNTSSGVWKPKENGRGVEVLIIFFYVFLFFVVLVLHSSYIHIWYLEMSDKIIFSYFSQVETELK